MNEEIVGAFLIYGSTILFLVLCFLYYIHTPTVSDSEYNKEISEFCKWVSNNHKEFKILHKVDNQNPYLVYWDCNKLGIQGVYNTYLQAITIVGCRLSYRDTKDLGHAFLMMYQKLETDIIHKYSISEVSLLEHKLKELTHE